MPFSLAALVAVLWFSPNAFAQTVTVAGTQHLRGLEVPPTAEQKAHAVEALWAFRPTQVCVERMGGARLHALCTADSQEDEAAGMQIARKLGGDTILERPEVRARFDEYLERLARAWDPDGGPAALVRMLAYMNSDAFAEFDREMQWETLVRYDNEAGAFRRRLMYWHARTAQISSELYRALAQGTDERVILIIGAAHRAFTEAELRSQPWLKVVPAATLFEQAGEAQAGSP